MENVFVSLGFFIVVLYILFASKRTRIRVEGYNEERFLQFCIELNIQYADVLVKVNKWSNHPKGIDGGCDWLTDGVCNIWLADINDEETLFHELQHLKQMIDGRFYCEGTDIFFDGGVWTKEKVSQTPYYELPWEKELWSEYQ